MNRLISERRSSKQTLSSWNKFELDIELAFAWLDKSGHDPHENGTTHNVSTTPKWIKSHYITSICGAYRLHFMGLQGNKWSFEWNHTLSHFPIYKNILCVAVCWFSTWIRERFTIHQNEKKVAKVVPLLNSRLMLPKYINAINIWSDIIKTYTLELQFSLLNLRFCKIVFFVSNFVSFPLCLPSFILARPSFVI